ncbi:MAG: hypothetical protein GY845_35900 [Planctomycetes bacterium]|nr:hypothetical protein [Planctomycetota bacterium]
MNVQKKPAARLGQQAASKTTLHKVSYTNATTLSRNLKDQIGELLLFGDKQQRIFWKRFESQLRLYADLRVSWGDYE